MSIEEQIQSYIESQPGQKRADMLLLHQAFLKWMPNCTLWFLDGKNEENKVVSNPNIGYGMYTLQYASGKSKTFYQIGLSGNTTGISVYIMGIRDKNYLAGTYGGKLGKAKVTGYCIKFKSAADINTDVLEEIVRFSLEQSNQ